MAKSKVTYPDVITFKAPAGTVDAINAIADQEQMKIAELMRQAVKQLIADYREVQIVDREQERAA